MIWCWEPEPCVIAAIRHCGKPIIQWQCSFHLKAVLPLVKRLATDCSHNASTRASSATISIHIWEPLYDFPVIQRQYTITLFKHEHKEFQYVIIKNIFTLNNALLFVILFWCGRNDLIVLEIIGNVGIDLPRICLPGSCFHFKGYVSMQTKRTGSIPHRTNLPQGHKCIFNVCESLWSR